MEAQLKALQTIAKKRGGKCLSRRYLGVMVHTRWQCELGHIWRAVPNAIKNGQWCPVCANARRGDAFRHSIKDMQNLAREHGGKCLSKKYINARNKIKWQCKFGHTWLATPGGISVGHWCHVCRGGVRKGSINDMRALASKRGGKCLSGKYYNNSTTLRWKCSKNHIWQASSASIKRGSWCPVCGRVSAIENTRHSMEEIQAIAASRGGECLSKEYTNPKKRLLWKCAKGHTWPSYLQTVKGGNWCPICSAGLGERICREYFEQLLHARFPKSRPSWLKNNDGYQLELDGYCKEFNLAFEHQGRHHYTQIYYLGTKKALRKYLQNDQVKRNLCKRHGIKLIEVPQILLDLDLDEVKPFIKKACNAKGIHLPKDFDRTGVKLQGAYSPNSESVINELRDIAANKGGELLSQAYLGCATKLKFRCHCGHEWEVSPNNVKRGKWCPKCARKRMGAYHKLSIEEMRRIARSRGGECLSKIYVNAFTKLKWKCKLGHTWYAVPCHIKRKTWCPRCAGKH